MASFSILILCVTLALSSARSQFGGNSIFENQQSRQTNHGQSQDFYSQNPANEFKPNPNYPFLPSNIPNQGKQFGFNREGSIQNGFDEAGYNPNPNALGNLDDFFNSIRRQLSTTTKSPQSSSTSSSVYLNCTRNQCRATNEHNPICGTDQINYSNVRKLECTNFCGKKFISNWQDVTVRHFGVCRSGS